MMKFKCKNCNAKLQAEESKVGQVFPCPKCAEPVVVPSQTVETDWFGDQASPEAPRTPPRSTETTTRQMVHPDVWDVSKMVVAHLLALIVFGVIAHVYLEHRMGQVQTDMKKQLEAIPQPSFDPSEIMKQMTK